MNPTSIDIHCDLLSYLQVAPHPNPLEKNSIGCSLPSLEEGNVKLQVMAIYTSTEKGSTALGQKQSELFRNLANSYNERIFFITESDQLNTLTASLKLGILAAIENASVFCEEDEPLQDGFKKLEKIISNTERILYIGLTHHSENRFGGGNSCKIGLKDDGKTLLNYINDKKIAIDFSHTSDALAFDILNYISKNHLNIPIMASHSNFREVFNHPRNLPNEIAKEIIHQKGLIGINFLRAFLNNKNPNALYDHILHGINLGGSHSICFGADYFYTDSHPDQSRKPFFFKEHENASCYPSILHNLSKDVSSEVLENISHKNAINFIQRIWS